MVKFEFLLLYIYNHDVTLTLYINWTVFFTYINSNLGPISHCYQDTATHWLKITNFSYPFSFSTDIRGDPFGIYGKALQFLKLESSKQLTVKIWRS